MATIKSYTDISQSKKLVEILPLESADMCYQYQKDRWVGEPAYKEHPQFEIARDKRDIPCWSLAALLEYMNRNFYNISLNYCGSEYTISFDDGEEYKTITKNYSIDAAFDMICWLKENNRI